MGKVKCLRLGMGFASIVAFKAMQKDKRKGDFHLLLEEMCSAACGKRCM